MTTCCSATSPRLCLHPPLGPHLWRFRGHGACGFFRNWPGRKTWRLQTNRTISSSSDWVSPPELPPLGSPRLRPTSTPTVEVAVNEVIYHPRATSPLYTDHFVLCFVGRKRVKVETTEKPQSWRQWLLWMLSERQDGIMVFLSRSSGRGDGVGMCIAGDWTVKWRSDISKQGHCVSRIKWGYKFLITSHKETRGTLNKNKKTDVSQQMGPFLAIVLSVTLICVPMLVPASMSTTVFVFPPKPLWRPPLTSGAWNWSSALSSHNVEHKQEI